MFPCVAKIIDQSTRHERTGSLTKVHTRYNETLCALIGGEWQRPWTEEASEMLRERVKGFKRLLVETFDEHCDSSLYTIKYHLLDHFLKDLRKFRDVVCS